MTMYCFFFLLVDTSVLIGQHYLSLSIEIHKTSSLYNTEKEKVVAESIWCFLSTRPVVLISFGIFAHVWKTDNIAPR